jgi:hypothetical protein
MPAWTSGSLVDATRAPDIDEKSGSIAPRVLPAEAELQLATAA